MLHFTSRQRYGLELKKAKRIIEILVDYSERFSPILIDSGCCYKFMPYYKWISTENFNAMNNSEALSEIQFDDATGFYFLKIENCEFSMFWHEDDDLEGFRQRLMEDLSY